MLCCAVLCCNLLCGLAPLPAVHSQVGRLALLASVLPQQAAGSLGRRGPAARHKRMLTVSFRLHRSDRRTDWQSCASMLDKKASMWVCTPTAMHVVILTSAWEGAALERAWAAAALEGAWEAAACNV